MKKAIFLIILLFIVGCDKINKKEKDMTISVPTSVELVLTNVVETIPLYDPGAVYNIGDLVVYESVVQSIQQVGNIYWTSDYLPVKGQTVLDNATGDLFYIVQSYIDEPPNEYNTLSYADISDYILDIEAFDQVTNYCYPVGPSDTVCFTFVAGETWDKTTSGPYGGTEQITIFETWREGMEEQQYFFDQGNLYRRYESQDWLGNTRFYQPTTVGVLPEFSYYSPLNQSKPFDGKNNTLATIPGDTMTYTVKGINNKFNTLALGRLKAELVDIIFKDPLGVQVGLPISKTIDTSRDPDGNLPDWYTTDISYSSAIMEPGSTVEITITGQVGEVELGSILLGQSVDAGFTKLNLQNQYIDYSVVEENQFGSIDYVERGKVAIYNGSCDIFIDDYDRIDRLMTSLGAQLIILNGSDSNNTAPDGQTVFAATQKIGRLFNFKQQTKLDGKRLHQMAPYTFTLKATI